MSQFGTGFALSQLSGIGNTFFSPWLRTIGYWQNRTHPSDPTVPPVPEILRAYWAGRLGNPEDGGTVNQLRVLLSDHAVFTQPAEGDDDIDTGRKMVWGAIANLTRPMPDLAHVIGAARFGWTDSSGRTWGPADVETELRRQGFYSPSHRSLLTELGAAPNAADVIDWWRRGWLTPAEAEAMLRWAGVVNADVLRSTLRQYDATMLSPMMAIEASYRLTPARIGRYAAVLPGVVPYGPADLQRVMTYSGYDAATSAVVQAVNRPQVQHRQIMMGVTLGIRDASFVADRTAAEGYLPDDVQYFVDLATAHELAHSRAKLQASIEESYDIGTLDQPTATAQLQAAGMTAAQAGLAITAVDVRHTNTLVRQTVERVRGDYLKGEISQTLALQYLATVGVTQTRAQQYMDQWDVQFDAGMRRLNANEVLSLVSECMMSDTDAITRLNNLGWVNADALLLIAKANAGCLKRQGAILAAQQRSAAAAARAVQHAIDQADRQAKELLRLQERAEPLSDLKRFYVDGIISAGDLAKRMLAYQYPPEFITWTLADLDAKKARIGAPGKKGGGALSGAKQRGESIKALVTLASDGVIDEATFRDRMKAAGYPQELIDWQWTDLVYKIARAQAKAAKQPAPAPPGPLP